MDLSGPSIDIKLKERKKEFEANLVLDHMEKSFFGHHHKQCAFLNLFKNHKTLKEIS